MDINDLNILQHTGTSPCVTITMPLERKPAQTFRNELILKKAIREVAAELQNRIPLHKEKTELVRLQLEEAHRQLAAANHSDGLAIFACPDFLKLIYLPYRPNEEVLVDDHFDLREVFYAIERMQPYYVLSIGKTSARLFSGSQEILHEVKDDFFPAEFSDSFEYQKPQSHSRQGRNIITGQEKSTLEEKRIQKFYHEVDANLNIYLKTPAPVFLSGVERYTALFLKESKHSNRMACLIPGSHENIGEPAFAALVWPYMLEWQKNQEDSLLQEIKEAINRKLFTSGLENVRDAVRSGNCQMLFVEKGYHEFIHDTRHANSDAVSTLLEEAYAKRCRISVLEDGSLPDYQRIGLILHYPI